MSYQNHYNISDHRENHGAFFQSEIVKLKKEPIVVIIQNFSTYFCCVFICADVMKMTLQGMLALEFMNALIIDAAMKKKL